MTTPALIVRRLDTADLALVTGATDLFDDAVRPHMARRFLAHPDHHLFGAVEGVELVGFVSAVSYLHPDKPVEFWINEVGVQTDRRCGGIGRRLMAMALEHAWLGGCGSAWVLTDSGNTAAHMLYRACGGRETPASSDPDSVFMVEFAPHPF